MMFSRRHMVMSGSDFDAALIDAWLKKAGLTLTQLMFESRKQAAKDFQPTVSLAYLLLYLGSRLEVVRLFYQDVLVGDSHTAFQTPFNRLLDATRVKYPIADTDSVSYAPEVVAIMRQLLDGWKSPDDPAFEPINCFVFLKACLAERQHPAVQLCYQRFKTLDHGALSSLLQCYFERPYDNRHIRLSDWLATDLGNRFRTIPALLGFAKETGLDPQLIVAFYVSDEQLDPEGSCLSSVLVDALQLFNVDGWSAQVIELVVQNDSVGSVLLDGGVDFKYRSKITARLWLDGVFQEANRGVVAQEPIKVQAIEHVLHRAARYIAKLERKYSDHHGLARIKSAYRDAKASSEAGLAQSDELSFFKKLHGLVYQIELEVTSNRWLSDLTPDPYCGSFVEDGSGETQVVWAYSPKPGSSIVEEVAPLPDDHMQLLYGVCLSEALYAGAPFDAEATLWARCLSGYINDIRLRLVACVERAHVGPYCQALVAMHVEALHHLLIKNRCELFREVRAAYGQLRAFLIGEFLGHVAKWHLHNPSTDSRVLLFSVIQVCVACRALPREVPLGPADCVSRYVADGDRGIDRLMSAVRQISACAASEGAAAPGLTPTDTVDDYLRVEEPTWQQWVEAAQLLTSTRDDRAALRAWVDSKVAPQYPELAGDAGLVDPLVNDRSVALRVHWLRCEYDHLDPCWPLRVRTDAIGLSEWLRQLSIRQPELMLYFPEEATVVLRLSRELIHAFFLAGATVAKRSMGLYYYFKVGLDDLRLLAEGSVAANKLCMAANDCCVIARGVVMRRVPLRQCASPVRYMLLQAKVRNQFWVFNGIPSDRHDIGRVQVLEAIALLGQEGSFPELPDGGAQYQSDLRVYAKDVLVHDQADFGDLGAWFAALCRHLIDHPDHYLPLVDHLDALIGLMARLFWLHDGYQGPDQPFEKVESKIKCAMVGALTRGQLSLDDPHALVDAFSIFRSVHVGSKRFAVTKISNANKRDAKESCAAFPLLGLMASQLKATHGLVKADPPKAAP